MAIQKDIIDDKGILATYHRIKSFIYENDEVRVTVASYASQGQRDTEKQKKNDKKAYEDYEDMLEVQYEELDAISLQMDPDKKNTPEQQEIIAQVMQKTDAINNLVKDPMRPVKTEEVELHYKTEEYTIPYVEPLTLESLYGQLEELDDFSGGQFVS